MYNDTVKLPISGPLVSRLLPINKPNRYNLNNFLQKIDILLYSSHNYSNITYTFGELTLSHSNRI